MTITFTAIGTIHTPFKKKEGMPIQPKGAIGVKGRIVLSPELSEGLKDLDGFSHIILLYHLHKSEGFNLSVIPFLDTVQRGLFATRAPKRPNPIGLSVVKLLSVKDNILEIENVDILDETPLLDIKPYIPEFDKPSQIRTGWHEVATGKVDSKRSDDRFT